MTIILDTLRLIALAFLGTQPVVAERGLATRFGDPGDLLAGNHLYCTGKKVEPKQEPRRDFSSFANAFTSA